MVLAAVFSSEIRAADDVRDASVYKDWSVSSVAVRGLDKKTASALEEGLALALSGGFLGTKKPIFFPQTLDEDIRRARLFLARRGYPYSQIDVRFEPNAKDQEVGVVFDIRSGPPVRAASVTLDGIPEDLEKKAAKTLSVPSDSVVVDGDIEATVNSLTLILQENGYARAKVESRLEWRDSTRVDVVFSATPGPICYFGDITTSGADDDLVPLVERVFAAHRGERYEPAALDDSQKNLRILGLFRQIRLDLRESAPDTLAITANLTMREPRRIETGVRYWTDDQLDLAFKWTHRNLFKRGRGGSITLTASAYLQRVEFTAWWPAVVLARSRLSATVGTRRESEESYEQTTTGLDAALAYEWSLHTKTRWGAVISNVAVTEKTSTPDVIAEQDGLLAALTFSWEQDRSDSPIVATRGTYIRIDAEWAPVAEFSDYHYALIEPSFSAYAGVPKTESTVLALRLAGGLAEPRGSSTDILPSKRFFSGGASSMRGFNRRKLGPLDSAGAPLGGEAKFEGSVELRFPLFWRFRATGFVDAGQVWPTSADITMDNIEVAVGPGLWMDTAIGPIRTDLGYRLTDYDTTQPRWVFHFSIGPAF